MSNNQYSEQQILNSVFDDTNKALNTNAIVGDELKITDGTTTVGVIAGNNAMKVDIASEGGTTISKTNPLFAELTDGTNEISGTNPLPTKLTDGTNSPKILARNTGGEQPAAGDDALVFYVVGGTRGVSMGGYTTYVFTPTNSFGHGTSAYATGTTFTVSGHSFTPEAVALLKVDRYSSAGVFAETLYPNKNTITASTTSGVTTYTYSSGTFSAGDLFVVYQSGPERTTTLTNDAQRNSIINRDTDKDTADTLLALTNIAAATTAYGYVDVENSKFVGFSHDTSGTTPTDTLTLSLEATWQNDGTAAASCFYHDVGLLLTGAATYVDTDCLWIIDVPAKCKYFRVKYVTSNTGGSDADLTTYVIKGV